MYCLAPFAVPLGPKLTLQCSILLKIQYSTLPCSAVFYFTLKCSILLYLAVQYSI